MREFGYVAATTFGQTYRLTARRGRQPTLDEIRNAEQMIADVTRTRIPGRD